LGDFPVLLVALTRTLSWVAYCIHLVLHDERPKGAGRSLRPDATFVLGPSDRVYSPLWLRYL